MKSPSYCYELNQVLRISCPVTLNMIFYRAPFLITIAFAGALGKEALAATALAMTLCNVTGWSIVIGLSSALTSLTSQATGAINSSAASNPPLTISRKGRKAKSSRANLSTYFDSETESEDENDQASPSTPPSTSTTNLPLTYLKRGYFVHFLACLPISIFWIFGTTDVLTSLGQDPTLSRNTSDYLSNLSLGLLGHTIVWTLTPWMQAINLPSIPAVVALFTTVIHIPVNYFFIYYLDMGFLGAARALSFSTCAGALLMYILIFYVPRFRTPAMENIGMSSNDISISKFSMFSGYSVAISFKGCCQYLSLAVPGVLSISEWWASEVAIFLAGRLNPDPEVAVAGERAASEARASIFWSFLRFYIGVRMV